MGHELFGEEGILWIFRLGLFVILVVHVISALLVWRTSRAARPVAYEKQHLVAATLSSRSMRWGGLLLGTFIFYHFLHLTTGSMHPTFIEGEVYRNIVLGFQQPLAVIAYVAGMTCLGLHLYHGIWSGLHTLGASSPRQGGWQRKLAASVALLVVAGNISIPVAALIGIIPPGPLG